MQRLTAAPRDHLTEQEVMSLLTGDEVDVDFGADLLNADLSFVEDISADLVSATVERRLLNRIHATARFQLSRELEWGTALVRLWQTLSNATTSARFNVGVFATVTPEHPRGETPVTYDVAAFDRLYLLDREVGDSYEVAAGTEYLTAIRQAITDAGLSGVHLDGSAQGVTLPSTRTWPLIAERDAEDDEPGQATTWLRIINDLLTAINYRGIYANHDGLFRSEPYVDPARRAVEWTFDALADDTIVAEDRTVIRDLWRAPNRWVFVSTSRPDGAPEPTEGDGVYTVDNVDDGPASQNARGLVWPKRYDYQAANQTTLEALGDRRVALDKRTVTKLEASTGPMPLAGHADIITWRDSDGTRKAQAVGWEQDLTGAQDTRWSLEEVS